MNNNIGEKAITPPVQEQITPDVVSPQGKSQLFNHLAKAVVEKSHLDSIFQAIADKTGAKFSSRIKNPETTVQKIAQKRMQGRGDYSVEDVNDIFGARFSVEESKIPKVIKTIDKLDSVGLINIINKEQVKKDTYSAYHIDFTTPRGVSGEIQIHTPQSKAESLANHEIRANYGEKPPSTIDDLKNAQAKITNNMSNKDADNFSSIVQRLNNNSVNLSDPRIMASILSNYQK